MSNHIAALLEQWYPQRDECDWVLGMIWKTSGPCYRKAGAMMLFNSLGQQFGMLSGGCLESDIQTHARKVMQTGQPAELCYDGSDEDDLAFQLGIGCGGTVYIQLQAVTAANHYLHLTELRSSLQQRQLSYYQLRLSGGQPVDTALQMSQHSIADAVSPQSSRAEVVRRAGEQWLICPVKPPVHLLVAGGGVDARPVVAMAKQLGWQVSLWDPRPANARREFFMQADHIVACQVEELADYIGSGRVNGVVMMTHNISLDAAVLDVIQRSAANLPEVQYLALLGPRNRRADVLHTAGLTEAALALDVSGPAGLDIGGELPESIALSMLAECHQVLHKQSVNSAVNGSAENTEAGVSGTQSGFQQLTRILQDSSDRAA